MGPLVAQILDELRKPSSPAATRDALLNAAFLFEKARGFQPCGWPDEVIAAETSPQDMRQLKDAVCTFVERAGFGTWALSKSADSSFKPLYVQVLRRQVDGDAGEMFQAMIALDIVGEDVFGGRRSRSILDEAANRRMAREYLKRQP